MKFVIIHNVYSENPFVDQTIRLNLMALTHSNINYRYIVFNDHGSKEIIIGGDIANIELIYSPINYGKKKCTGGWVGAFKEGLIEPSFETIVHNIGQDDVLTPVFYQKAKECFDDSKNWYFTSNGFKVDEQLRAMEIMINPTYEIDYERPGDIFKQWFGIEDGKVTRANNGMLASGTMYRSNFHELIGEPDLDNFEGAADFEYWARILFYGYKGKYLSLPSWYYRQSNYSAGNEVIDGKPNRGYWQQLAIGKIKEKYSKLYEEKLK